MGNFWAEIWLPFFILLVGTAAGMLRAYIYKTPLAQKGEFVNYIRFMKKPVLWSFIVMFLLFFLLGLTVNNDKVAVFQKSFLAGLYAASGIFIMMIWGANLIRKSNS